MRKTREILRQKWELGRSHRDVARSLSVSVGVVGAVLSRARAAKLDWAAVAALGEVELDERLYGKAEHAGRRERPVPDCAALHVERSRPGVTLELLHLEYLERHPDGYRYTQFCEHYRAWLKRRRLTMRQVHGAGEKLFVDYSGKKPHYVDTATGEIVAVEFFVAVLGASSYTYAEASRTQSLPDWIESHVRALQYFGGVARALVPDQLKSAVTTPGRYEPGVQRTYEELARHYNTAVVPARPAHPRDKAKVEAAVLVAQRWILARLRNQRFFSLSELNERIAELLEDLNTRVMKVYGVSRRALYERLDRPALRPLPPEPFQYAEWKRARVNIDYHVDVEHHFYSVPHALVHEEVEVRVAALTVEVFHRGVLVAAHGRSRVRGRHTTTAAHMPRAHQKHLEWTPSRLLHWASTIGVRTAELVAAILADRPHPEQGYRSCLGILRLAKRYGDARLEAACARAGAVGARSYRHVDSILKNGLDRLSPSEGTAPAAEPTPSTTTVDENIRGRDYYN